MELEQFYRYQAKARRLTSLGDVRAMVARNTRLYDIVLLPWLPEDRTTRIYDHRKTRPEDSPTFKVAY